MKLAMAMIIIMTIFTIILVVINHKGRILVNLQVLRG